MSGFEFRIVPLTAPEKDGRQSYEISWTRDGKPEGFQAQRAVVAETVARHLADGDSVTVAARDNLPDRSDWMRHVGRR